MARYYIDTNVLVGYSFLQNLWQSDTKRLLDTDNTLYVGEIVLYEYCVKNSPGSPPNSVDIDWAHDAGKYGDERRRLRKAKRMFDIELRRFSDEELSPESVAELFIDEFDIQDRSIAKIQQYFTQALTDTCSTPEVEQSVEELVNTITSTAKERKLELARRVNYLRNTNKYLSIESRLANLIYGDDQSYVPDATLLWEAYQLKERGIVSTVVTGDKGDIYLKRGEIDAITGLSVLYLQDQFAAQAIFDTQSNSSATYSDTT